MSDEENSLAGRARRYAQVTGAMGGLAARLAGQRYLGIGIDRDRHAAELKAALGGLKGPLMKVAQLLATIPGALPEAYAEELRQLQANAPAMGWPFVRRRMAAELGPDWERKFAHFEHAAAAAASLGQVHRATGLDGRPFAVKLQYSDMGSAVEADLNQLKLVFRVYERYERAISTEEIHAEIAARLREELDYALEARHMRLYSAMLAGEAHVHVPEPVAPLSTRRLITMSWLEGEKILDLAAAPQERRNHIAVNMFRAWYVPFYYYGAIHGDPHLGNYSVRADDDINLLDFGCVRLFRPSFVAGVIDLYHALERDDEALAAKAYGSWGFGVLTPELMAVLNRWAAYVYAPLLDDRARRIQEAKQGALGHEVARGVHGELKRLGGVGVPREFVFLDRSAIGLGSVFTHLKAEVNWHRLFQELIADFSEEALAARQKKALESVGLLPPA
jgi:predicted unusual protein kinase regulating ubiquinone biosynthesis (AarF/ABC1/UbiB family)